MNLNVEKGNFIKRHNFPQMLPASWHMKDGRTVEALQLVQEEGESIERLIETGVTIFFLTKIETVNYISYRLDAAIFSP